MTNEDNGYKDIRSIMKKQDLLSSLEDTSGRHDHGDDTLTADEDAAARSNQNDEHNRRRYLETTKKARQHAFKKNEDQEKKKIQDKGKTQK